MATILLVEDHIIIQDLIRQILEGRGCKVILAATAITAIAAAETHQPDAILLDLGLPDHNGFDVIKILQLGRKTRHIPVVAMTDYGIQADRERCLRAGFTEYLTKPVTKGEIYSALEAVTRADK